MEVTIQLSRSRVILYLILICVISLGLKLYIVDFSIPPHGDDIAYVQDAIQYNEGDFFLSPKRSPGWSLFLAPFMSVYIWGLLPVPIVILTAVYAFIDVVGLSAPSGIAHGAHLAGLIVGIAFGLYLRPYFGYKRQRDIDL